MKKVDSVGLFDSLASTYDQVLPMFAALGQGIVESLHLHHGERLLDVGCGRGAIGMAASAAGADVVAVDAAVEMVRALKLDAPAVDARVMDARELDFSDNCFDIAVAAFMVNVVGDQAGVIAEMSRVVTPGGRVVLALPGPVDPSWECFFALFENFTPCAEATATAQPADAPQLLMDAGLLDVRTWHVTVDLEVDSPEQVWQQSMTHGFAGYVGSLTEEDREAFKETALRVLGEMQESGSLRLIRTAEVTGAQVAGP